jgi:hypothetical protein
MCKLDLKGSAESDSFLLDYCAFMTLKYTCICFLLVLIKREKFLNMIESYNKD